MTVKQFRLPDPGEGLTEAEVVTWRVKTGDTVNVNDIVVEIDTAKSLVELPVPFAGTVTALHVGEGETVEVGTPIISVETGDGGAQAPAGSGEPVGAAVDATRVEDAPEEGAIEPGLIGGPAPGGRTSVLVGYGPKTTEAKRRPRTGATGMPSAPAPAHAPAPAAPAPVAPAPAGGAPRALAKPPVRKYAKDIGVDLAEVVGTGDGGTITRADVEAHGSGREGPSAPAGGGLAPWSGSREETRVPIRGVRKITAQAMVASAFTAPHVTEWITVDVSATMELVERLRQDREFADVKVSPLLVLAKAMCLAIRRNPEINASWDEPGQEIVVKPFVNLGIAAATPRGLVVPNVKDADLLSMRQLADRMASLVATAREGRTPPADMSGGTITVTNVGVFGVDTGTPILNPGEAAIVAFGAVRRMPWVVTAPDGTEAIEPRWVTQLGVSFDHRLVDGALGSRFLADVAAVMHDPAKALVWG
ncbi:MAG: dihydrolipoamide acetyltransferase family protein [Lapillicoccus sp.]